jgi:hypothetical protein
MPNLMLRSHATVAPHCGLASGPELEVLFARFAVTPEFRNGQLPPRIDAAMRITAITTIGHNVGDDFVREGIFHLLKQAFGSVQATSVHKHLPITARPEWEWVHTSACCRLLARLPGIWRLNLRNRLDRSLPLNERTDKILNCDLLVQCGAPVYWLHGTNSCGNSEWYEPLIRRRWVRVRDRVPLINLAGGSCQTYGSDGAEFEGASETLAFIREFYDSCRLTTLRDVLAGKILKMAGRDAPVLPCTSIFARFALRIEPQAPQYVVLNYMRMGGHYRFSNGPGPAVWAGIFRDFVNQLPSKEDYVFACHTRAEMKEVHQLFPGFKIFWSADYRDYLKFFAQAKYGIVNRVHAAFAMASFGRPSLVIGNDSRARMSDLLGLKTVFVDEVTTAMLLEERERLGHSWRDYAGTASKLQLDAEQAYLKLLRQALVQQQLNYVT